MCSCPPTVLTLFLLLRSSTLLRALDSLCPRTICAILLVASGFSCSVSLSLSSIAPFFSCGICPRFTVARLIIFPPPSVVPVFSASAALFVRGCPSLRALPTSPISLSPCASVCRPCLFLAPPASSQPPLPTPLLCILCVCAYTIACVRAWDRLMNVCSSVYVYVYLYVYVRECAAIPFRPFLLLLLLSSLRLTTSLAFCIFVLVASSLHREVLPHSSARLVGAHWMPNGSDTPKIKHTLAPPTHSPLTYEPLQETLRYMAETESHNSSPSLSLVNPTASLSSQGRGLVTPRASAFDIATYICVKCP